MSDTSNEPIDRSAQGLPNSIVAKMQQRMESGERFEITADGLATETNTNATLTSQYLETLQKRGELRAERRVSCLEGHLLDEDELREETCTRCNKAFSDFEGQMPVELWYFIRDGVSTRDPRWILALHGMNTDGAWQEKFSWQLARQYGRSIPIAIYKYGKVIPGAIVVWRQRALTIQLLQRIASLNVESEKSGFGNKPDVIAHSLGTWLLGHALVSTPTLRVGRVVLTGSILRPDFNWKSLVDNGQVEAVLCHYGTRDIWASVAHYVIPDSGPSGRLGFIDRTTVAHVRQEGFRHSDFFVEEEMESQLLKVWIPFLQVNDSKLGAFGDERKTGEPWTQAWWPFRATALRFLSLMLLIVAALSVAAIFSLGVLSFIHLWPSILNTFH